MKKVTVLTFTLIGLLYFNCNSFKKPKSTKYHIAELERLHDSLGERNRLLLREYSYNVVHNKLTRDQAFDRAQEMKKIGERRIEIQHQIDSLKLLPTPNK
ncbi:hypothetical protein LZZ90_00550 [Flavobacterium sp. SM15]|uniref:hypothetical protein n=1 Tax=Flavobacterium sp. SM15 TaxID=2908005 RepID=UPI001EDC4584|nr:hypothetical protein [Flavobacterium sp. SM15]MCG2609991.1 hypothetical protein [Flavobacterium sp. SM15]